MLRTDSESGPLSVNEVIDSIGFGRRQLIIAFVLVAFHSLESTELHTVVLLGAVLTCSWRISRVASAFLSTCSFLGMLAGALAWGVLADRYGRRDLLIIANTFTYVMIAISAFSPSIGWMLFLRFMIGFGIVGAFNTGATLCTELIPTVHRAKAINAMFFLDGVWLIMFVLLYWVLIPAVGWRITVLLLSAPGFILSLTAIFLPRSPRFLLLTGQRQAAIDSLRFLVGSKGDEIRQLTDRLEVTPATAIPKRDNLLDLLRPPHRLPTLLLMGAAFGFGFARIGNDNLTVYKEMTPHRCLQNLSQWSVTSYTTGDTSCCRQITTETYISALMNNAGPVVLCAVNMFIVDRLGRKRTFIVWAVIAVLSMVCFFFCLGKVGDYIPFFFLGGSTLAIASCLYIYVGEYYPTSVRATGMAICSFALRISYVLGPFPAQILIPIIGMFPVIFIYMAGMVLVILAGVFLPVETAGLGLKQTTDDITTDHAKVTSAGRRSHDYRTFGKDSNKTT